MISIDKLIGLALIGATVGCANLGDTYEVRLGPSLTPTQEEAVIAGLDSWTAAVPALRFHIFNSAPNGATEHTINVTASTHAEVARIAGYAPNADIIGHTDHDNISDIAYVWLDVETNPECPALQKTAGHEVGHAMGLSHIGHGLMEPFANLDTLTPQRVDVEQWYSARGMTAP